MFKYICMPKLVAFYLREFSARSNGEASTLYKFVFCLCLPFVSQAFRVARLRALAIAECTQSADQIERLIEQLTGIPIVIDSPTTAYMTSFDGSDDGAGDGALCFPYSPTSLNSTDNPIVPYIYPYNTIIIRVNTLITLEKRSELEAYLQLLIPFYVKYTIQISM